MTNADIATAAKVSRSAKRSDFLGVPFDRIGRDQVLATLRATRGEPRFRYVVTPNVDHVVRLSRQPELRQYYDRAWLTLCDSKPVWMLAASLGRKMEVVTGADLTAAIFAEVLEPGDRVNIVVASADVAADLSRRFPHLQIRAHVPPQGILERPEALRAAVDFIVSEPANFHFLAIGSPQSEMIADLASQSDRARGVAACIGASLEFMVGARPRAPRWMRAAGMEWVHRLATDPRRLWRRYLFAFAPLLRLYVAEIRRRPGRTRQH